jgi:hypothetical protein
MHLPLITTFEHAAALAERTQDRFYLAAFKLQSWVSELSIQAIAEYAEKAEPAERPMQTGQAWRAFQPVFGKVRDESFHHVINCINRFAFCENPLSFTLLGGMAPVFIEHELTGDYLGPNVLNPSPDLMRRSVQRLCDWLDAVIHLNTHRLWFLEPACFDPDPEKRRLAAREISQPYIAQMADSAMFLPYTQPGPAHRQSKPACASPVAPDAPRRLPERPWPFPKLDEYLITLWPLVKLHNWTYVDFWKLLSDADVPLAGSPCQTHRGLATYCFHTLGLRKCGHGRPICNLSLPGYAVAQRFLHPKPSKPALGHGPWS